MSLTNFDEIYQICCDWDEGLARIPGEDIVIPSDPITDAILTRSNRWWEMAVKEVLKEREKEAPGTEEAPHNTFLPGT